MTDRQFFAAWIEGYERAWRTPGTESLSALFTEDATYRHGPYDEPVVGLAAIKADWETEREGPDEEFDLSWSIVAVEGPVGVARLEVRYGAPVNQEYQDLWLVRFAGDGRCAEFEEWPYWPPVPG